MIISRKFKIIAKNKEFIFKKIELREVNKSYVDSLSFAKRDFWEQLDVNYIKKK